MNAFCKEYVDGSTTKCRSCLGTVLPEATSLETKENVRLKGKIYLIGEYCCPHGYYWHNELKQCQKDLEED